MIELTPLARPYAKAVFASALDAAIIDETKEELKIMALASLTPEVQSMIEDPIMSKDEILESLKVLFDGSISKISQSLLNVLAENNRLNLLEAIFEIYQEIVAKHKEQKAVEVFVATEPSEDTTETIKTRLVSAYGEGTNIEFKIDPNIMGGLSIKVGDETLDLSIRGKVKKLINQLNF
tara:strand:+ start:291 stop:827 length:537 start_codon:yes stop_codon:yes gene_type:complete